MRMRLLGRFGIIAMDGESTPIPLPTRKAGALLAYLGMSRDYAAGREELAALLWGECSDQQARQSLRQALALLRKELGPSRRFTADARMVRLDPALWSIDARDFEMLARSQKAEDLSRAASLFAGDFLAGLNIDEEAFEAWVNGQRTRLQLAAGQLCETFVKRPDLVIDANQALAAVEQLMALDPLREDWQRLAIALYARYRGRNEALARAAIFAGLLQRELGVAPEKETRVLLESVRGNEPTPAGPDQPDDSATRPALADQVSEGPMAAGDTAVASSVSAFGTQQLKSPWHRTAPGIAVLALVIGMFGVPAFHTIQRLSASPTSVPASLLPSDPWRSPSSAHEAQLRKGIVPVVVLPFTDTGRTDDRVQLIADMLTDDLTNTLSRVSSFRVISRNTARSFQGQTIERRQNWRRASGEIRARRQRAAA